MLKIYDYETELYDDYENICLKLKKTNKNICFVSFYSNVFSFLLTVLQTKINKNLS